MNHRIRSDRDEVIFEEFDYGEEDGESETEEYYTSEGSISDEENTSNISIEDTDATDDSSDQDDYNNIKKKNVIGKLFSSMNLFVQQREYSSKTELILLYITWIFPLTGCLGIHWILMSRNLTKNRAILMYNLYRMFLLSFSSMIFNSLVSGPGLISFRDYPECDKYPFPLYCYSSSSGFFIYIHYGALFFNIILWAFDGASLWYYHRTYNERFRNISDSVNINFLVRMNMTVYRIVLDVFCWTLCLASSSEISQVFFILFRILCLLVGFNLPGWVEGFGTIVICGVFSFFGLSLFTIWYNHYVKSLNATDIPLKRRNAIDSHHDRVRKLQKRNYLEN